MQARTTEEIIDEALAMLKKLILELDQNARAYGFEVGRGCEMRPVILASSDNPFLSANWERSIKPETLDDRTPVVTVSDSERLDMFEREG